MPTTRFFSHAMFGFILGLVVLVAQLSSYCDIYTDDCDETVYVVTSTDELLRAKPTPKEDTLTTLAFDHGADTSIVVEHAAFWPDDQDMRFWFGPPPQDLKAAEPPDTPPII